jgi:hypothetical protein
LKAEAPDGLLCDVTISTPNAAWSRLQRGVGGAAGILPSTLPGVLVALADLDPALGGELDGSSPMYGAVAGVLGDPAVAFAIKLADLRHARTVLLDASGTTPARYTAKALPGSEMTLLVPARAADRSLVIAFTPSGWLIGARKTEDLIRLGPYVTSRASASASASPSASPGAAAAAAVTLEFPRRALQSALEPALESMWTEARSYLLDQDQRMRAERGRAPDFGDPAAIVTLIDALVRQKLTILGDLERVRIALDVEDDALGLVATLTPASSAPVPAARAWVDAMHVGDASAALALPASSIVALSMRDGEAERAAQARELESGIVSALGARLKDPSKLHGLFDTLTKARDESFAVAFALDEASGAPAGILLRAPVRDAEAARQAMGAALDLSTSEPFKELLRVRDLQTRVDELPGLGKVDVATLQRDLTNVLRPKEARDSGAPTPAGEVGAAWSVRDGAPRTLLVGAGREAQAVLKAGASPERTLADEPSLRRFTSSVGNDATTLLVLQPLRIDPARAPQPAAPLALAIGKRGGDAFVRLDVSDALLREAMRWQMGF